MFIGIGGNRVFYRKSGSGEPTIFLHGFPTSSYDWRKVIPQLSKIGSVIAPDLYGFGYSDLPKGEYPAAAKLFRFLHEFVSALQIESFKLVAYDWGGIVAVRYAVEHPAYVSKMVLMNTTVYPDWVEHFRTSPAYSQVRRMAHSGFYRLMARSLIGKKQVKHLIAPRPETVMSDDELNQYVFFVKQAIGNMSELYSEDSIKMVEETTLQVTSKLKELEIPTLLLWGQDDIFVPPEHGRHFNEDLKRSKLVVLEDTGHFIVEERPQQVADAISGFLAQ